MVILLDGGFSTQLVKYTGEVIDGDPLWSARFLVTEKEKCAMVHRDYVIAGAEIISTGSYQASICGYRKYLGLDRLTSLWVIRDSVLLARQGIEMAKIEHGITRTVLVAGSVGPYGACLHDGSEYTGTYQNLITENQLIDWHRPRIETLVSAGVDILAIETIPCLKEALALLKLLEEYPSCKAWITFSIKDSQKIGDGGIFEEVIESCWQKGKKQLVALGANCLHPSLVIPLFRKVRKINPHIPLIVYPNNGEKYDVVAGRWIDQENSVPIKYYISEWLSLGIDYIGGCCRTSDIDICEFNREIKKWQRNNK